MEITTSNSIRVNPEIALALLFTPIPRDIWPLNRPWKARARFRTCQAAVNIMYSGGKVKRKTVFGAMRFRADSSGFGEGVA